jgi:hypothetical protein
VRTACEFIDLGCINRHSTNFHCCSRSRANGAIKSITYNFMSIFKGLLPEVEKLYTPTVPEPFTIIGTLVGGTAALRMKKKLKVTNKLYVDLTDSHAPQII